MPCYLVEWYRPELTEEPVDHTAAKLNECAASMSAEGSPVQLVTMLAVPCDEVLFGIFTGSSATIVAETCDRAGLPALRVIAAVELAAVTR